MLSKTILAFFLASVLAAAGCSGGEETTEKGTNTSPSPSASTAPSVDPLGNVTRTPEPKETVEAVTLKPVVDAFCDAMRKKDEAGLRRVYSKATLRSFEQDMRADGIATLHEFLSSEPVGAKCGVVNERILGNVGEALVTTETYPNGVMLKFVKEDGEWKMTNQSSDFDSVTKGGK